MPSHPPLTARTVSRITDIEAADWDACAGGGMPFLKHGFFRALEESGSVAEKSGWRPQHLVLEDERGQILGLAPLYLKHHSYGEYVFDHAWANAYARHGLAYYPKLQVSIPFTPVTGRRLLVQETDEKASAEIRAALATALMQITETSGLSSLHVTFLSDTEYRQLGEMGFLLRLGEQFHWENHEYEEFDAFLAALSSRKRKAIRKERREAQETGVEIKVLSGDEITPRHWDAFHGFYLDTVERKWAFAYLNREFFELLGSYLGKKLVLIVAEEDGQIVAAALNFLGEDTLYGRNWGCGKAYRFLHFELCYYQAIEFAIRRGLKRVEAGAQGPHKLQRGYLPRPTYSAHWIADPHFREAIAGYLERERAAVEGEIAALAESSPFRKNDPRSC